MEPLLSPRQRRKLDARDDASFYTQPRLVQHVDEGFRARLTQLYRECLPGSEHGEHGGGGNSSNARVLDLMSSWVSHLPPERSFARVVGHGLNAEELRQNPRLDDFFAQNLNETPALPFADAAFDAVLCAVSVQYLERPGAVFGEVARVLAPGGVVVVSFSNRMFFSKAVAAWRDTSETGRLALAKRYLASVPTLQNVRAIEEPAPAGSGDPFYAVLAERAAKRAAES